MHRFALLIAVLCLAGWGLSCAPAEELRAGSPDRFSELAVAQQPVDVEDPDYALLNEAIFHETNRSRELNGLGPLTHRSELDRASCAHAEAMVSQDFFAHRNPNGESAATPLQRVRAQGLEPGYVAENIGQVFALRYDSGERVFVREEGGRTVFSREPGGEPLGYRSYLELAQTAVASWLGSEGHRANILSERASQFGAGCQLAEEGEDSESDSDMPMFLCVQLFFSPLHG